MNLKYKQYRSFLSFAAATGVLLISGVAWATSQTWDGGGSSGYWTNNINWNSNTTYPNADETATFNSTGGNYTNISVAGLSGIKYLTFDTSSVGSYTFGGATANAETLILRNDGNIRNTVGANKYQYVNTAIQLGPDKAGSYNYYLQNDNPSVPMIFNGTFSGSATSGTAGDKFLYINGIGAIKVLGNVTRGNANNLDVYINNSGATTLSGTNLIRILRINGGSGCVLDLGSGVTVFTNSVSTSLGGENFSSTYGGTINGTNASFYLTTNVGEDNSDNYVADLNSTLTINCRLRGSVGFEMYTGAGAAGTFALNGANDFAGNVFMNASGTISANKFGNRGSTDSGLGAGYRVRFSSVHLSGPTLKYTGVGEDSNRQYEFASNGKIEQAGSGNLNLTWPFTISTTTPVTINIKGSSIGTGEISGALSNGSSSAVSILKDGTGTWSLSANNVFGGSVTVNGGMLRLTGSNTYASATAINGGTLSLSGASGSIPNTSGITLGTGGTLSISNSVSANQNNRVRDTSALTLNGGAIVFVHPADGTSYAETLGAVSLVAGANVISASRAATGQTSALTFTSLARTAGSVDFVGMGLGTDARNRIFITGQADGLIGPWATVNGSSLAAYSITLGVYPAAATAYTDIAARGPSSTIPNSGAAAAVRINSAGVSGAIALAQTTTTIGSLHQNTATAATVDTAAKTLEVSTVIVPSGKAALSLGATSGDGTVTPATTGGGLLLANDGDDALAVNAVIADKSSASSLIKSGVGTVTLTAANTFSGGTSIGEGSLVLAHANALQNSTLTVGAAAPIFDNSVSSHAFALGALAGTKDLALRDSAGTTISLAAGQNNASTFYGGVLSGAGSLVKQGNGTLTLAGANTHQGGTTVQAGRLIVSNVLALGTGPAVNNGTLDFMLSPATYSGASTALSGTGTNNITIANVAGASTYFSGDYRSFTGVWNVGVATPVSSAGRVVLNGPDNAAATVVVRTNATLLCNVAVQHNASLTLQGGNTGESNGQLRMENSAIWAGSIILAGVFTDSNDGFLGCASGTGYLCGPISDALGGPFPVGKLGGSTLAILNTNNTFAGQLWIRAGTLRATSIRNVGEPSSLGAPATAANGVIKIGNSTTSAQLTYTGSGDTSDRVIDMTATTGQVTLDHSGTNYWTMTSDVTSSGAGSKRLQLQGSILVGTGVLSGAISDYSSAYSNNLYKTGTGAWKLTGNNTFKGVVYVDNGSLIIANNNALGNWPKTAQAGNNANGASPNFRLDGSQGDLTIPDTITFRTSNQRFGAIFNDAGNNTILGSVQLVSGDGDTILNSLAGKLTVAGSIYAPFDTGRQLRLWGAGDGELSGAISNGVTVALPIYKELGTGTWTLSGSNTYSGVTYANDGTLVIGGVNGSIAGAINIGGGALIVSNTPSQNHANRLSDSSAVILNGGTLGYAHSGGAADYAETAGTLTVATGENAVKASRADDSHTATLTFAALSRSGGSVNFAGDALGDPDNRNRILFTSAPVADNAVIGPWALYNGTNLASYTAANGIIAAPDSAYTALSAKGPSVVPNDASAIARISEEGSAGGIALAGDGISSVNGLLQATAFDAAVGLTNQTFKVSSLIVGANMASLTVGTNTSDGLVMPLASGGALMLANHSGTATLTVNTPITNNTSASSLVKIGSGPVRLNGRIGYSGTTAINEGDLIVSTSVGTQSLAAVVSGNGNLVKEGPGGLTLGSANTHNGQTVIRGGILMPLNNGSFGSTIGATVVTNGGTLDVGFSGTDNAVNFANEPFFVSGKGVNERGAIINSSVKSQYNAFRYLTLVGDTTFGGENSVSRWDIRNSDSQYPSSFDMRGFTVTKVGSNMVGITTTPVVNPGHFDIREGTITTESATLYGDSNNVMTVQNGALYDIYNMTTPIYWKLVMNDGSRFYSRSGNGIAQNVWAGPVVLNGYSRIDSASGTSETLAGDIGGAGSLVKIGSGPCYVTGTNNSYSGGTYVSNNWLYVTAPGGLPYYATPGKVQVATGAGLYLYGGDGTTGWTADQLNALHGTGAFVASNSILAVDTTYAPVTGLGNMAGFALYKYGTNALTLTGVNTNRASPSGEHSNLRVYAGKLVLSAASSNIYGRCYVLPGSVGATLQIDGLTTFTESLYVGNGNGDRSTVIVNTNTTANRAWVGISQIANGALIQNGGTFEVAPTTGGTQVFEIGRDGAYGYYRMNGGTLRTGQFAIGGGAGNALTANCGVFDQFGGVVNVLSTSGWLIWGWAGGNGVANLFNGTLVAPNANWVSMAHTANYGSFGMLNLLGSGAFFNSVTGSTSRTINMATAGGNLMSVINLNAGTILANKIYAGNQGTPTYFNFAGGTLLANGGTTLASTFLQDMTAATVYPGGAVIDSSNATITVNQPLLAPTGYGVSSIAVANGGAGYIGAPVVTISGGSGTGATAIASVDLDTTSATYGQVTAITVTSPGVGYQITDSLAVTLLRGGYTTIAQVGVPVFAPNQATGGLTKQGSGTLTLGGTNTYGGATTISAGTLKLGNASALSSGTEIVLAGGTLDLNGFTVTNALRVISGVVSNGTLSAVISPAGEGVIGDETITLKSSTIRGTYIADVSSNGACDHVTVQGGVDLSGLIFTLVNPELLDRKQVYTVLTATQKTGMLTATNLPDSRWHLISVANGAVNLVFVDGTMMLLH